MSCATCGLVNPERGALCMRCGESLKLDYFQVLGVSRDATAEQIRKARREKLRGCHPDLVNTLAPEFRRLAGARATQINGIADTLCDPAKRRAYLASRQTARPAASGSTAKPRPAETPRPGGQKAPGGPGSPGGERGKAAPGASGGQPHIPKSAEEIWELLRNAHSGATGARQAPPPPPADAPRNSRVREGWMRAFAYALAGWSTWLIWRGLVRSPLAVGTTAALIGWPVLLPALYWEINGFSEAAALATAAGALLCMATTIPRRRGIRAWVDERLMQRELAVGAAWRARAKRR